MEFRRQAADDCMLAACAPQTERISQTVTVDLTHRNRLMLRLCIEEKFAMARAPSPTREAPGHGGQACAPRKGSAAGTAAATRIRQKSRQGVGAPGGFFLSNVFFLTHPERIEGGFIDDCGGVETVIGLISSQRFAG